MASSSSDSDDAFGFQTYENVKVSVSTHTRARTHTAVGGLPSLDVPHTHCCLWVACPLWDVPNEMSLCRQL